jgi:fructose-1,6-bisphosphatase/inositol monophosphatase family enzyme
MSLTNKQLHELCEVAKKAALAAGEIIASKQGSKIEVQEKSGGENIASCVVTEVDLAAEKEILSHLLPTLEPYKLGLLTEESVDDSSRFDNEYFWCIDPLDGTLCFSRNEDGYSTSIALVSKAGVPVVGAVYSPRHKILYSAIKGYGAYKNDILFKVKESSNNLTLLFDQSYLKHPYYTKQIKKLETDLKAMGLKQLITHPLGGAVMNGITTVEMAPALYYKFPKKADGGGSLWDFAASSIIQSEAGGYNSDYFNNPIELNREGSTFMNHKGIIYSSSQKLLDIIPIVK